MRLKYQWANYGPKKVKRKEKKKEDWANYGPKRKSEPTMG
jgi:hypothetical protein